MVGTKLLDPHTLECPSCKSSWDAGDIPKENHKYYSPPYKYFRVVGIEVPGGYDGISYWQCPDCNTVWDRWTGEETLLPKKGVGDGI